MALRIIEAMIQRVVMQAIREAHKHSVTIHAALSQLDETTNANTQNVCLVLRDNMSGIPDADIRTPRKTSKNTARHILPRLLHCNAEALDGAMMEADIVSCAFVGAKVNHLRMKTADATKTAKSNALKLIDTKHVQRVHNPGCGQGTEVSAFFCITAQDGVQFSEIADMLHERLVWSSLAAGDGITFSLNVNGEADLSFHSDCAAAEASLESFKSCTNQAAPHARSLAARVALLASEHFPWWNNNSAVVLGSSAMSSGCAWSAHAAAVATFDDESDNDEEVPKLVFLLNGFPIHLNNTNDCDTLQRIRAVLSSIECKSTGADPSVQHSRCNMLQVQPTQSAVHSAMHMHITSLPIKLLGTLKEYCFRWLPHWMLSFLGCKEETYVFFANRSYPSHW